MTERKAKVCRCGTGYASRFDGKCSHCRNKRERTAHSEWIRRGSPESEQAELNTLRFRASADLPFGLSDLRRLIELESKR